MRPGIRPGGIGEAVFGAGGGARGIGGGYRDMPARNARPRLDSASEAGIASLLDGAFAMEGAEYRSCGRCRRSRVGRGAGRRLAARG